MNSPIDQRDIATFREWLDQTVSRAERAASTQQHSVAANAAHCARKFCRTLRHWQAEHGFLAEIVIGDTESRLDALSL
jgi:hypothetical protein